jgi:hypothetical protein
MSLLHTKATGNTAFIVNADSYVYYGLVVPQSASNVSVQGHFTATGNSDNDIVVYLLTEKSFVNWQNGYSTPTLYYSGRVTRGSLNVSLPSDPATYYIVFSNIFSEVTAKAVQTNVSLRCDRLQDHLPNATRRGLGSARSTGTHCLANHPEDLLSERDGLCELCHDFPSTSGRL